MKQKIPSNSTHLQKRFPQIYKNFFSQYDIVISTPHLLQWGHAFAKILSTTKIKQKLPNNLFLGVNNTENKKVNIKIIHYFSHNQQQFISQEANKILDKCSILEQIFQKQLKKLGYPNGLSLSLLAEYPKGHGVSFTNNILLGFASILTVLNNINNFEKIGKKNSFFDAYKKEFTQYYQELNHDYYRKNNNKITNIAVETALGNSILPYSQYGSQKGALDTLFSMNNNFDYIPFDFGIISYGLSYTTDYLLGKNKNNPQLLLHDEHHACSLLQIKSSPFFAQHLFSTISESLQQKLLSAWKHIIQKPRSQQTLEYFFAVIAEHGYFNSFLEKEHKLLSDTYFLFNKARIFSDEKIALTPLTSGKTGGSFLFVTHYQKSRESLYKLKKFLHNNGHNKLNYTYLSREDGKQSEPLCIKQFISKGFYSHYIQADNVVFQDYHSKHYIGTHRDIIEKEKQSLILDFIDKKIYFQGKTLTHKDIRSQSGTVEIMDILIKNKGIYVSNNQFPRSSYSKNKNEMIGKIITPLQLFYKKHFGKKLSIKCSGSIYNFDVILEEIPQNIVSIKKIFLSSIPINNPSILQLQSNAII